MFSCEFCEISKKTFFYRTRLGDCFYKILMELNVILLPIYLKVVYLKPIGLLPMKILSKGCLQNLLVTTRRRALLVYLVSVRPFWIFGEFPFHQNSKFACCFGGFQLWFAVNSINHILFIYTILVTSLFKMCPRSRY